MAALVLVVLPIALLCIGVPIFVALIGAAAAGMVALHIGTMEPVHMALFGGLDNFPLLAVPLFTCAAASSRRCRWSAAFAAGLRLHRSRRRTCSVRCRARASAVLRLSAASWSLN